MCLAQGERRKGYSPPRALIEHLSSERYGASSAECRACTACDHNGRTDSWAVSNGWVAIMLQRVEKKEQ